jgi:flavorubredoxin
MEDALMMADRKRVKNKKAAYIGSYAWSGGAQKNFERLAEKMAWEVVGSIGFIGGAKEDDLARAREMGAVLARAVKEDN